jgi:biofilm PGA synthesis N-glycosyltransferase PgaC
MMYTLLIASGLAIMVYCVFIVYVSMHFKPSAAIAKSLELPGVSILIPCRNEERHIAGCLEGILKLDYPAGKVEVIIIDDGSEDQTVIEAGKFENRMNLRPSQSFGEGLRIIQSASRGKKAALETGIREASNNLLVTTDADCVFGPEWLKTMATEFQYRELNMLCGLVQLNGGGLFENLQQAESAAIVGISAVMLNQKKPTTCNGAGLMFRRDVFEKLNGYSAHAHLLSGDDDLLMQQFAKLDMEKTGYLLNSNAIVRTSSCSTFREFMQQRSRWLSKRKAYIFPYNQWVQTSVFLHLLAFYGLFFMLFTSYFMLALCMIGIKYTVDF